jgi:hypothetical protein
MDVSYKSDNAPNSHGALCSTYLVLQLVLVHSLVRCNIPLIQTINPPRMPRTFCPTDSLTSQPVHSARKEALRQMYSHGFKYSRYQFQTNPVTTPPLIPTRKLTAHNSCVNCVTFSRNDGRWLASAGDDFRVHLWDFSQEDVRHPSHTLSGPVVSSRCCTLRST